MIHPVHPEFMILEPYKSEEEIKVGDVVTLRESSDLHISTQVAIPLGVLELYLKCITKLLYIGIQFLKVD